MSLRSGLTTGTCAAAAAKAAVTILTGRTAPQQVEVQLPSGTAVGVPVLYARPTEDGIAAVAAVRKDAGDDPDVTHGVEVLATVSWSGGADVVFSAGDGVGTVTKPGLQIPPGEPAINPVPRQMIAEAVRQLTPCGVRVEIAIPGGREIAAKTFNPRLGIEGGLSILGTTGIVRPYCVKALHDAIKCSLDVAVACGITAPVLVAGNIGARAARGHFNLREQQVIEVGNAWQFTLDAIGDYAFQALMVLGHPGKLAKLAAGHWDTHSAHWSDAPQYVAAICRPILERAAMEKTADVESHPALQNTTVEGVFAALPPSQRKILGDELATRVQEAVAQRIHRRFPVAVLLNNMAGECLGGSGDFAPWK